MARSTDNGPHEPTASDSEGFHDLRWIDRAEYRLLRALYPGGPDRFSGNPYEETDKLEVLLGPEALRSLRDKVVVDFGCGEGREAIAMVHRGARTVIGVDLRQSCVDTATALAEQAGVGDRCFFTTDGTGLDAEVVVSLDSFEHFDDPAHILEVMHSMLRPGGRVITTFGPTWYHPYGGHSLSAFPWAHLLFTERALLRWRADLRKDGATRFREISGGLNQLSISEFERYVADSDFEIASLELVPIRKVRWMHTRATREFTTSVVRCELRKAGISSGTAAERPRERTRSRRIDSAES